MPNKYTVRLLSGGVDANDKSDEWDSYLVNSSLGGTIQPGDNNVWNWSGSTLAWTSTTPSSAGGSGYKTVRGSNVITTNTSSATNLANNTVGFRPVLLIESLSTTKYLFEDGSDIKKYVSPSVGNGLVPILTSNISSSPIIVSAQDETNGGAWKAFDDGSDDWSANFNILPAWLKVDFGKPTLLNRYVIEGSGSNTAYNPKSWDVEGSNDGSSWTLLHNVTNVPGWGGREKRTYTFSNSQPFRYIRINVLASYTSFATIEQIQFYYDDPGGWQAIGTAPATQAMFDTDGMSDLSMIDKAAIQSLVSAAPKLLVWTDGPPKTSAILTAVPNDHLIMPTGDINIPSQGISSLSLTATGVKVIASSDSGATWKAATGGGYTSDLCSGGTIIGSVDNNATNIKGSAFDNNTGTFWESNLNGNNANGKAWIGYDYGPGNPKHIRRMNITQTANGGSTVTSLKVQCSDDGSVWADVQTLSWNTTGSDTQTFDLHASRSARYWRILANASTISAGSYWQVNEIEMMEIIASTWTTVNQTNLSDLKSNGMTLAAFNAITTDQWRQLLGTSNKIRFAYYLEQALSTDTVNADLIALTANPVATQTPTLDSLKVTFESTTLEGRLQDLEQLNAINISKLNFKSNALLASAKYSLYDMVVDTFATNAGVEASSTTATYDTIKKEFNGSGKQIVMPVENLPVSRKKLILTPDHDGATFEISTDGGTTWGTATPFTIIDLTGKTGNQLKVRATLADATSKLRGIAYSWA